MISFQNKFCLAAGVPTLTVSRSQPSLLFKKDSRSSDSNRQSFQVWGRHSWRESANEGPFHAATSSKLEPCCLMGAVHAAQGDPARSDRETHSLPETAWLATYSSLRRKKSTRQAGEMRHNARRFSALLVRAVPSTFEWLLETRFNRACVFACVLTWLLFKSNVTSQKREEKA